MKDKVQVGIGFKAAHEIIADCFFTDDRSGRLLQEAGRNWRRQRDAGRIVGHDDVQVVRIPSADPIACELPSFLSRDHIPFSPVLRYVSGKAILSGEGTSRIWRR